MRAAVPADVARIVEMGRAFHARHNPPWPWDGDAFGRLMMGVPFLTIGKDSFFAGMIAPNPISPEWIEAHELFWWSRDGTGLQHLRAFRRWARAHDANEIKWSCHSRNERVKRAYARLGRPAETYYSEVI